MWPVLQDLFDASLVMQRHVEAPGFPVDMLEFLARLTDGRSVNNRHHLFDIVHHDAIEQVLVPVLQSDQVQVAFEIRWFLADVAEDP